MAGSEWASVVADHKQRQALRIGRAAVDLTLRDGLAAVSMSALAKAAGVSRATLYSYVPDVPTAIGLYLTAQSDAFTARVTAAVAEEPDPEAKLRRYIREQVAYVATEEHRAAAALMGAGALRGLPHQGESAGPLRAILTEGVEAGAFAESDVDAVTLLIGRTLYAAHELVHGRGLDQDAVSDMVSRFVLDGVHAGDRRPI